MSGHVRERLSAYLDDELGPAERSQIAAHLAECPACAARLSELALVDSAVSELRLPVTKDDQEFAARVRARIEAQDLRAGARPHARPATRYPAWAWAAAAALLLAVMTPAILREIRPSAERETPEAPGPGVVQGPARNADALSRGAEAAPPLSLGERKAPAVAAEAPTQAAPPKPASAPALQQARRDRAMASTSHATAAAEATPPPAAATGELEERDREPALAAARVPAPAPEVALLKTDSADRPVRGVAGGIADAGVPHASASAGADRETAAKQERAEAAEHLQDAQQRAKAPAETAVFGRLAAQRPGTPEEWRRLRGAWREVARTPLAEQLADEALVRSIEAAAGAFRASGDPRDERVLEGDVAEYLARRGASQGERVRRVLREAKR